jgi:hypothetical protein
MATTIDVTKINPRTTLGYTQGLPLGVSTVDSNGAVAPIITNVAPSSTIVETGMMYVDTVASRLYIWNGTAWKYCALT